MMMSIICPACGAEKKMSLLEPNFEGPFKCWKCRKLYLVNIEHGKVMECKPLTEEEFDEQLQIIALKNKFRKSEDG